MLDFTTATRDQLKQVYNTIAKLSNDDRFFTTRELDTLPRILSPNEQVLAFSSGAMNSHTWLIVLTDQRVMFVDKGMFYGLTQLSIELSNIVSIEGQTHIMFGTITVSDASTQHRIENVWKTSVNYFVNRVREAREARRNGIQMFAPGSEGMGPPHPDEKREQAAPVEQPRAETQAVPEPEPDPDAEFWERQRNRAAEETFFPEGEAPPPPMSGQGSPTAPNLPTDSIFSVSEASPPPPPPRRPAEQPAPEARPAAVPTPRPTPMAAPTERPSTRDAAATDAERRRIDRLLRAGAIDQRTYDDMASKLGR